ncbi:MAG: glycosyltransferase [Candidatus Xenobia bacterium]
MDLISLLAAGAGAGVAAVVFNATYRFTRACHNVPREIGGDPPSVTLLIACKAASPHLEEALESLLSQDYPNYSVVFSLASRRDPAFPVVTALARRHANTRIVIAGYSDTAAEKTHNLVTAISTVPKTDVYAFADSDIRAERDWLRRLVAPLRDPRVGVTTAGKVPWIGGETGIWTSAFVRLHFATLLLAFGMPQLALAWGGSMALRREVFDRFDVGEMWGRAVDDDISVSRRVREHGLQVRFVPMFVPTRVPTTVRSAFSWCVRQEQYLWLYYRQAWLTVAFLTVAPTLIVLALAGMWAMSPSASLHDTFTRLLVFTLFCHTSLVGRILRTVNTMTSRAPETRGHGRFPVAEALLSPFTVALAGLVSVLAAFRRVMVWGDTVYLLRGPEEVYVLSRNGEPPSHYRSETTGEIIEPIAS